MPNVASRARTYATRCLIGSAARCGYAICCLTTVFDAAQGLTAPPEPPLGEAEIVQLEREFGIGVLQRLQVRLKDAAGVAALETAEARRYDVRGVTLLDPVLLEVNNVDLSHTRSSFELLSIDACCPADSRTPLPPEALMLPRRRLPAKIALEVSYGRWSATDAGAVRAVCSALRAVSAAFKGYPLVVSCGSAAQDECLALLKSGVHTVDGTSAPSPAAPAEVPLRSVLAIRAPLDVCSLAEVLTGRNGMLRDNVALSQLLLRRRLLRRGALIASSARLMMKARKQRAPAARGAEKRGAERGAESASRTARSTPSQKRKRKE